MESLSRKPNGRGSPPGKLKAAARAWALARLGRTDDREPVRIDEDLARQFRAMGADIAPQDTPQETKEGFEVLPENWNSVCAFLACETQWRVAAGLAGLIWLGLDYSSVDVAFKRLGYGDAVFADVQVMEAAALETFSEAET